MSGRGSSRGAAAVEFMLAAVLLLAPLAVASFELLQLAISRQLLQAALADGVRAAATAHGDLDLLRRVVARGLLPLHGAPRETTTRPELATAYLRSLAEVQRPDLTQLAVRSPSRADFRREGLALGDDRRIPNDGTASVGANTLDVHVVYCRALVIPASDLLFRAVFAALPTGPAARCLQQGRMPIAAGASTVMQSDASARALGLLGP